MNNSEHDSPNSGDVHDEPGTSRDSTRTEQLSGDLVAYLDGELPDTRSREIEATLVESEVVRTEVDGLQRSFDLLDLLPLAKASAEFSERTLANAAVEARREPVRARPVGDRLRGGAIAVGWVAGLGVAGLLGFLGTHDWIRTDADLLVRDLPVVENLDVYSEIGSVEFVTMLEENDLLPTETSPDREGSDGR